MSFHFVNFFIVGNQLLVIAQYPNTSSQGIKHCKKYSDYLYVYSETLIFPGIPVVSQREDMFTVFPNKQYLGVSWPITPVTTSPVWMPIVT